MIDERFAPLEFSRATTDSRQALAKELAGEIQLLLHSVVAPSVRAIVAKLNSLGHRLTPYSQPVPGELAFRDDWTDENAEYHCKLRFAVDTVISIGYADTRPIEGI